MSISSCQQGFDHMARSLKLHFTLLLLMTGLGVIQLVLVMTLPKASAVAVSQLSQQQVSLATGIYCTVTVLLALSAAWLYGRCQVQLGIARSALEKLGNLAHFQQSKRDEALEHYAQLVGALSDVSARMENIVRDTDPQAERMACERAHDTADQLNATSATASSMKVSP
jgi:hypothetical protein